MSGKIGTDGYPPLRSAGVTLVMLCLAMVISLLDRHLLGLMVTPIRADLGISDSEIALLQGLAFVVFYLGAGLIFGQLVDRFSRRNIISTCLAGWSVMTMLCGISQNFWQIFAARAGVGVGEAGLHPAAFSKLCDLYAPQHRGRAFGFLGWAGNLGGAASMLGGAALYGWLSSLEGLPGGMPVWKATFIAAGIPGLLVAVLFLFVREPRRRTPSRPSGDVAEMMTGGISRFLVANWPLVLPLLVSFALMEMACYAMLSWGPSYYNRVFGTPLVEAGTLMGGIVLIGSLGSLASGLLGDHWSRRRAKGGRVRAAMWAGAIGLPALLAWSLAPNLWISFVAGAVGWGALSLSGTQGPLILAELVPNALRGRMGSVYVFSKTGSAAIFGPLVVALFTEQVFRDPALINYSLACVAPTAIAISGVLAWSQLRAYDRTLSLVDERPPMPDEAVPDGAVFAASAT